MYCTGSLATALHRHALERHQENGSPVNSDFDISERDTPSPVSLNLGWKFNFAGPKKIFYGPLVKYKKILKTFKKKVVGYNNIIQHILYLNFSYTYN